MSERKQTAAENTATVEKTSPVVYCGPSVKNTVKQFTVYSDGDALWKTPRAARVLFLPRLRRH